MPSIVNSSPVEMRIASIDALAGRNSRRSLLREYCLIVASRVDQRHHKLSIRVVVLLADDHDIARQNPFIPLESPLIRSAKFSPRPVTTG